MLYTELHIETRREMPARTRTAGEQYLIRAGYVDSSGQPTRLGDLAIARLQDTVKADPARWALLGSVLFTADHKTAVVSPAGDFDILQCAQCGYADGLQTARRQLPGGAPEQMLPMERVETPACSTIDALAALLGIPPEKTAKALLYTRKGADQLVFVVVRGDMQASEAKLRAAAGNLVAASHEQIIAAGAVPGYASPIGVLGAQILVDELVPLSPNLVTGANEHGYHFLNTNCGRDYQAEIVADLALARPGDACPECGSPLHGAMGYVVAEPSGVCGVSTLLCLAERNHDEGGLRLPFSFGAFDVYLMHLPSRANLTAPVAAQLHRALEHAGIAVLYDDRDLRAGVKFNDADLIGCPVRITVGERHLSDRMVELKSRSSTTVEVIPLDAVLDRIQALSKMHT